MQSPPSSEKRIDLDRIYANVRVYVYVCMCMHVYACVNVYTKVICIASCKVRHPQRNQSIKIEYMQMYVCMYMYACVCMCECVYICSIHCLNQSAPSTKKRINWNRIYANECVCVCMCIYVSVCTCTYMWMCVHILYVLHHAKSTIHKETNLLK